MANDSEGQKKADMLQNRGTDTSFLLLPFSAVAAAILLKILREPLINIFANNGSEYYALAGICLIALVPFACTAGLSSAAKNNSTDGYRPVRKKSLKRFAFPVIASFIFSLMCAVTIDPVQKEGWLRTLFVSFIFATQAPVLVIVAELNLAGSISKTVRNIVTWLPLAALPAGLLLHRPWNIVTFFSPYYWGSWAWMEHPVQESAVCGSIAIGISLVMILALNEITRQIKKRI